MTFFSFLFILGILSFATLPINCADCRFFVDPELGYSCELSNVNVREENEAIIINGDHLIGNTNQNVRHLSTINGAVLNFIPRAIFETFSLLKSLKFE